VSLDAFLWGRWHGGELGERTIARPSALGVSSRLRRRRHLAAEEFTYLRARATRIAKVTLASPSLHGNLWASESASEAYPRLDDFLDHVAALYRDEIEELVRLGAEYIQLDAPHYPLMVDPAWRAFYEGQGWSADRWLARGIELDNHVMAGHPGVTFGLHLCRGNQMSRWLVEGGYEAIGGRVFRDTAADRLLLEYDDERSGSFEPLRLVPDGKTVVLGLVTTKTGRRETVAELTTRVHEAARHIDLERLAISPQCGFATSVVGNAISADDQRTKLELVARTARAIWP
jgi:5-methyltetrahydropteroyltriglutamate--homocysteine methyltransferase